MPNGEIGKYVTVARKQRDGDSWFIGSITNEEARELDLKLDFLDADATYRAVIYEDGPDADYRNNPYPMSIRRLDVDKTTVLHLHLAPGGGVAIQLLKN